MIPSLTPSQTVLLNQFLSTNPEISLVMGDVQTTVSNLKRYQDTTVWLDDVLINEFLDRVYRELDVKGTVVLETYEYPYLARVMRHGNLKEQTKLYRRWSSYRRAIVPVNVVGTI